MKIINGKIQEMAKVDYSPKRNIIFNQITHA
jgi:hypothetical protein